MPPTNNKSNGSTAVAERKPAALASIVPSSVGELIALAEIYYKAGLTPKGCNRPESVAAVIAAGLEIGLKPAAALNSMYIVNGKAALYGDAPLALVRSSGLLDSIEERVEGDGDARAGVCTMARKGDVKGHRTFRFTVADAKKAQLWGKAGPWTNTPDRMLQLRARGWLIRDLFGDVLMGMGLAEDLEGTGAEPTPAKVDVRVRDEPAAGTAGAANEPPTDVHGEVMADEAQLATIKKLQGPWLKLNGPNPPDRDGLIRAWAGLLKRWNVEAASKLTGSQADELIAVLQGGAAGPTAALFAPSENGQAAGQEHQKQPTTAA